MMVNGIEKRIDKEGPLRRCVYPGCNIDTNALYSFEGYWVPVCSKTHLSARLAQKLVHELKEERIV